MSIRAVDIVSMVPRLQEASRVQQQDQVQNLVGQQVFSVWQQVHADRAQHQVVQALSAQDVAIRKEERRQGRGGNQSGARQQHSAKQEDRSGSDRRNGHRLDIKV